MNRFEQAHLSNSFARRQGAARATEAQQKVLAAMGRERLRYYKTMFGVAIDTPLPLISKAKAWQIINHHFQQQRGL